LNSYINEKRKIPSTKIQDEIEFKKYIKIKLSVFKSFWQIEECRF